MQSLPQSTERFTYRDYCSWPDDERWELIVGGAYDMSPAPSRSHQDWVLAIGRQIANFLDDKPCRVYIAPFDVRLPERDEADDLVFTVVQPDLSVICDPSKLDDAGCRGAPDWIIEVLSPGTAAKDQIIKKALYERHGVREYWLVHPIDHILTRYRLVDGRYAQQEVFETVDSTAAAVLDGLSIDWTFAIAPKPAPARHPLS
ncbi:MAG: Uma2 family endonuclease [Methylococcaceae bacterium]|nr:Uma2 family endonuclease [Methylococcaceae bacterium]